jgi:coenzyme Q-binding protein COQ10
MIKIKKQIHIDAPVEKVFEFAVDPEKLPEIWPSMIRTENVEELPSGGSDYDWDYKMAGMSFHGHTHTTEFVPNKHVVVENKTGIPSKFVWDYSAENGGTQLDLEVEYEVPVPLLGKLAEKAVRKINENEAEIMLANLKVVTEM